MYIRASRNPGRCVRSPRGRPALIGGTDTPSTCRAKRLVWIMQRSSTTRSGNFTRRAITRRTHGSYRCKPPPRPGNSCGNFWILPRYLSPRIASFPFISQKFYLLTTRCRSSNSMFPTWILQEHCEVKLDRSDIAVEL